MATQTLEAVNPIVGRTQFIGLSLPPAWRITRATVMPDVATTVRQGERQWVAAGETRHVVFDGARRIRLDMVVQVKPGASRRPLPRLAETVANGPIAVGGHPGVFQLGRRREGVLSRRLVPTLRVRHYCDRTQRTILLELSGSVLVEEFRALLEAMRSVECHDP